MSKKQCRACVFMPYPLDHPCHTLIAPVLSLDLHHLELKSAYIIYRLSDSSLITPASIQCIMKTPIPVISVGHQRPWIEDLTNLSKFPDKFLLVTRDLGWVSSAEKILAGSRYRSRQQYRCAYGKVIWGCQIGTGKYSEKYLSQLV